MPTAFRVRFLLAAALVGILLVAAGCSRPKYEVKGVVAYDDGTPYSGGGIVAMEAEIDGKRVMARGAIGSDGRFTLASQRPDDGAFAGTYRVRVLPQVVIDGPATRGLDPRFQSFDTSGLSFEVGSGKNELTISLGPKPAP
jgi:hypothetical protein